MIFTKCVFKVPDDFFFSSVQYAQNARSGCLTLAYGSVPMPIKPFFFFLCLQFLSSMQMMSPTVFPPLVLQCSWLQKPLYNYFFIASSGTIKVTKSMNVCKAQADSVSCSVSSNCSHREDILSCRSKLMENPTQSRLVLEKCLLRTEEKIVFANLLHRWEHLRSYSS